MDRLSKGLTDGSVDVTVLCPLTFWPNVQWPEFGQSLVIVKQGRFSILKYFPFANEVSQGENVDEKGKICATL